MPSKFTINGKRIFVTWSQCGNLTREQVRELLLSKGAKYYHIAKERHANGGYHIHAYGEWLGTFRSTDPRVLDLEGYHPSIEHVRSLRAVLAYLGKEDTEALVLLPKDESGNTFKRALGAGSSDEFHRIIAEEDPRTYVLYHKNISEFADKRWKQSESGTAPKHGGYEWDLPEELKNWCATNLTPPTVGEDTGNFPTLCGAVTAERENFYF